MPFKTIFDEIYDLLPHPRAKMEFDRDSLKELIQRFEDNADDCKLNQLLYDVIELHSQKDIIIDRIVHVHGEQHGYTEISRENVAQSQKDIQDFFNRMLRSVAVEMGNKCSCQLRQIPGGVRSLVKNFESFNTNEDANVPEIVGELGEIEAYAKKKGLTFKPDPSIFGGYYLDTQGNSYTVL